MESIVWLNVATTASSDLLRILAITGPDGAPTFLNLTFQFFNAFPTRMDDAVLASSPYLRAVPPAPIIPALLPGIATL